MPALHFTANIEGPCETVFDLIAELTCTAAGCLAPRRLAL